MTTAPVDPRFALDSANSQDLVQKKLSIDAMKKRVDGGPSKDAKLRDACEGFESIFLQKMWEQMRKNVKKEGYLHSKDEEAYQSMFDTELAKKMASAGGIGLADMMYEQLSQKLTSASRTTGLGAMRDPLPIDPALPRKTAPQAEEDVAAGPPEDLYTEAEPTASTEPEATAGKPEINHLEEALKELAENRDPVLDPANATYPMFDMNHGAPMNPVAGRIKEETGVRRDMALNPIPEKVSAPGKGKPSASARNVNRSARHVKKNANMTRMKNIPAEQDPTQSPVQTPGQTARQTTGQVGGQAEDQAAGQIPAQTQGMGRETVPAAASESPTAARQNVWPVEGELVSSYGRQVGENGSTSWNTGVRIAAPVDAPVTAPMDGVVTFAGEVDGVRQVVLHHADGLVSKYTNVRSDLVAGDIVSAGTEFARISAGIEAGDEISGAAPAQTASRMGFEIRRGELALNPEKLLA